VFEPCTSSKHVVSTLSQTSNFYPPIMDRLMRSPCHNLLLQFPISVVFLHFTYLLYVFLINFTKTSAILKPLGIVELDKSVLRKIPFGTGCVFICEICSIRYSLSFSIVKDLGGAVADVCAVYIYLHTERMSSSFSDMYAVSTVQ